MTWETGRPMRGRWTEVILSITPLSTTQVDLRPPFNYRTDVRWWMEADLSVNARDDEAAAKVMMLIILFFLLTWKPKFNTLPYETVLAVWVRPWRSPWIESLRCCCTFRQNIIISLGEDYKISMNKILVLKSQMKRIKTLKKPELGLHRILQFILTENGGLHLERCFRIIMKVKNEQNNI